VIDRMKRTSGNVGQIVVVMPGVFVRRLALFVRCDAMMVVLSGVAGREIDADPGQRTERWEDERDQRKAGDDATPVATEPPATGWNASMQHGLLTSAHELRMIGLPV
jgi:hypothetical protein